MANLSSFLRGIKESTFAAPLNILKQHKQSDCPIVYVRHPGLDPGSLRTTDDAVTGDCGSGPAMTFFFYRCCASENMGSVPIFQALFSLSAVDYFARVCHYVPKCRTTQEVTYGYCQRKPVSLKYEKLY
jgi:hypothetical protein